MREHSPEEVAREAFIERAEQYEKHNFQRRIRERANGPDAAAAPGLRSNVTAIALDDFFELDIPKRETMLAPWLPKCGLAMIHAPRGAGKTQLAIGTAWAVASGGGFLRWKCEKAWRVCFSTEKCPAPTFRRDFVQSPPQASFNWRTRLISRSPQQT
jgi:hypothetical protein